MIVMLQERRFSTDIMVAWSDGSLAIGHVQSGGSPSKKMNYRWLFIESSQKEPERVQDQKRSWINSMKDLLVLKDS